VGLLRAIELVYNVGSTERAVTCRVFWSVKVTSVERVGGTAVVSGNSLSWLYDTRLGRLMSMLIGGSLGEALCFSIETVAEIQQLTGQQVNLPAAS
jgi:hypothetical protein